MNQSLKSKIKSVLLLSASFFTVLFYQNCSKPVSQSASSVATLTELDVKQQKALLVLTTKCSTCHNSENPSGGVDVMNVDQLLASGAVVPNEPSLSPLFQAISSGSMPPSKPLAQEDIVAISDWISSYTNSPPPVALPPGTAVPLAANYNSISKNILQTKCLRCHSSANSAGGVSFSTYASTSNTVQKTLPLNSGLYTSVAVRNTMPQGAGGSLSAEEKKAIFDWITAGGANN